MFMKKLCIMLAVLLMVLTGCQPKTVANTATNTNVTGSRKEPLTVGQTATYDGMAENDSYDTFKLEVTLLDTLRGEEALGIFLKDLDYNSPSDIPEEQELLIAKMTVRVLESKDDKVLPFSYDDINMFQLISEGGTAYDIFYTRQ